MGWVLLRDRGGTGHKAVAFTLGRLIVWAEKVSCKQVPRPVFYGLYMNFHWEPINVF